MALDSLMGTPLGKYSGEGIGGEEEPKDITPVNNKLDNLVRKYKHTIDYGKIGSWFKEVTTVLDPSEIDQFLQTTSQFDHLPIYEEVTSHYLKWLVQNSFKAGNNDFKLNILNPTDSLLSYLEGSKERSLKITINGNLGDACLLKVKNLEVIINGDVQKNCAESAKNTKITVNSSGFEFLKFADNCTAVIKGMAAPETGYAARKTAFYLHGDWLEGLGNCSEDCTFNVYSQEQYDRIIKERIGFNPTIIFGDRTKIRKLHKLFKYSLRPIIRFVDSMTDVID